MTAGWNIRVRGSVYMVFVGILMFSGFARLFAVNLWFTERRKNLSRLRRRFSFGREGAAA